DYVVFFFHCPPAPRYLHSFPTRRSSDLGFAEKQQFTDMKLLIVPDAPWWRTWGRSFDRRVQAAVQRARQRAAVLKQREQRAKQRSEEHTSELQSRSDLVCRLLLEKKKKK